MESLLGFIGVLIGSVLTFFGVRFTARQSAKAAQAATAVSDRQVDVEEWRYLVTSLQEEVSRLSGRVTALEAGREEDRSRIDSLSRELRAREIRYGLLVAYVRDVLAWARRLFPDTPYPPVPISFADELTP